MAADPLSLFENSDELGLFTQEKTKPAKKPTTSWTDSLRPELDPHTLRALGQGAVAGVAAVGPAAMEFVRSGSLDKAAGVWEKASASGAYTPSDPEQAKKTGRTVEAIENMFVRYPGSLAVEAAKRPPLVPPFLQPITGQAARQYEPEIRMVGEIAGQFVPLERAVGIGRKAIEQPAKAAGEAEAYQQWKESQTPTGGMDNPLQLEFDDSVMRGRQQEAAASEAAARLEADRVAAAGEVEGVAEQQAILNRELGQPDLFDSPISRTQEFEAGPAQPSLRSKERGPDITELSTDETAGRAAPLLTEQELYGPVPKRETPARTLDAGVTDESAKYEAQALADEAAYVERVNAMNKRQTTAQQTFDQIRKEAELDLNQPALSDDIRLGRDDGLAKFIEKGDFRGSLEYIRENHKDPYFNYLADLLLRDPEFKVNLAAMDAITPEFAGVTPTHEGGVLAGLYIASAAGDQIVVSRLGGYTKAASIILHEAVHAKVARLQHRFDLGQPLPRAATENLQTIKGLFDYVKGVADPAVMAEHGMRDWREFVAEGFTNMKFQKMLKDLNYKPKPGQGFLKNVMSAWDAFVLAVSKMLGLDPKRKDVLSALLNEGAKLMREIDSSAPLRKAAYTHEFVAQQAMIDTDVTAASVQNKAVRPDPETKAEFLEKLKSTHDPEVLKRFGDFLYKDYKEKWDNTYGAPSPHVGYDNRDHATYKTDLFNPDGGIRIDDVSHAIGPAYTESKRHPVIRRVYDQVSQAENAINNVYDDLYRGQTVETGKGISALRHGKLKESKDSMGYVASRLKLPAIKEVMDLFGKYGRSDPAKLLDSTFIDKTASPEAAKFFRTLKALNESALKKLNEARAKAGLEEIPARPDWVTTFSRPGKFHVFTIDHKTGRSEWRAGFDSKSDADKVAAAMRAKGYTDIRVAGAQNDPRRFTLPPEAFHEAIKAEEDPARRKMIQEALESSIQRTGTRKYALPRDSKAGGTPGDVDITAALGAKGSFEHLMYGIKSYVNSVANYAGGLDYAKRVNETLYDNDIRTYFPNAVNAAKAMWDTFRGVDRPSGKIAALIHKANMAFTAANVTMLNTPFYLANAMQFGFVPPRLIETNATTLGGKGNTTQAMLKAISRMYVNYDGEAKAIIREAVDNGSLEARFAEALEWRMAESSWENAARNITLQKAAAISDSFARGTAYMMFYDLAKSAGKTNKDAHSFAARESQGIMVQYSRWARMPFFNKIGPLGDLASPLTQFITNLAFNLGQYIKLASVGDKKAGLLLGPLLAYLTAQAAMSGVRGLPGYEDLDAAVGLLNQAYVEKFGGEWFGTPSEWLHDQGLSDYVVYGVPSAASQVHMTGTLGAGHLLPGFLTQGGDAAKSFPGVDYGTKLVESVMGASLQAAGLTDLSDATRERIISQVAPGALKEWVKELLSGMPLSEGRMVGGNKEAVYLRSPQENVKSLLTGKPSLREFEAKEFSYLYKKKEQSVSAAKTEAINQLVDSIVKERDLTGYTERVLTNYPELVDGIMDKAQAELKSRQIPFYERTLMEAVKGSNLAAPRKVQTLEALFGDK